MAADDDEDWIKKWCKRLGTCDKQRKQVFDRCLICNDDNVSLHYGVPSCAGCKSFFRRSILGNSSYECDKDGKCDISGRYRLGCRACRFRKCVEAGMRKQVILNHSQTSKRKRQRTEVDVIPEPPIKADPWPRHLSIDTLWQPLGGRTSADIDGGQPSENQRLQRLAILACDELASFDAEHHNVYMTSLWQRECSVKRAAARRLEVSGEPANYVCESSSCRQSPGPDYCAFSPRSLGARLTEANAYLTSILGHDSCFNELTENEKMTLLRKYASVLLILTSAVSLARQQRVGDTIYLLDGVHVLFRNATGCCMTDTLLNEFLDQMVPRCRELKVDDRELICLKQIVFWNADIICTNESQAKVQSAQTIAQLLLQKYIEWKTNNDVSAGPTRFGNLLMLLRWTEDIAERACQYIEGVACTTAPDDSCFVAKPSTSKDSRADNSEPSSPILRKVTKEPANVLPKPRKQTKAVRTNSLQGGWKSSLHHSITEVVDSIVKITSPQTWEMFSPVTSPQQLDASSSTQYGQTIENARSEMVSPAFSLFSIVDDSAGFPDLFDESGSVHFEFSADTWGL